EFLVVQITGVHVRRVAVNAAPLRGRRNSHAPKEGAQWNDDVRIEKPEHPYGVQLDYPCGAGSVAESPDESAAPVVPVWDGQLHREHSDFEHIPRLGALHINRAGQDMAAR